MPYDPEGMDQVFDMKAYSFHSFPDMNPAHTSPALVLSIPSPILHGQSGAERSGLILSLDAE